MGRIVTSVTVTNPLDPAKFMTFDALVDTGAAELVLPSAWRERLGTLPVQRTVEVETDQRVISAAVSGPVTIRVNGFDTISGEVMFLDMEPPNGRHEPLVGYIVLEQSRAAVDLAGHRLVPVRTLDLK